MTWGQFREAVDYLGANGLSQEGRTDFRVSRRALLQCLEALGHCDVYYKDGESKISVTPPSLYRLPRAGLPLAVLAGARSIQTLKELDDAAKARADRLRLTVIHNHGLLGLIPDTIQVSATEDVIVEFCATLRIRYVAIPPAWSLMHWAGMLSDYEASMTFRIPEAFSWARFDFDDKSFDFGHNRIDEFPRYSCYRNPITSLPTYIFFRDGHGADVDLNWGRYLLLNAKGITITAYDERRSRLCVPVKVPLPGIVARTICLCSGKPPIIRNIERLVKDMDCQDWLMFEDVPPQIALSALSKVGQTPTRVEIR